MGKRWVERKRGEKQPRVNKSLSCLYKTLDDIYVVTRFVTFVFSYLYLTWESSLVGPLPLSEYSFVTLLPLYYLHSSPLAFPFNSSPSQGLPFLLGDTLPSVPVAKFLVTPKLSLFQFLSGRPVSLLLRTSVTFLYYSVRRSLLKCYCPQ